MIPAWNTTLYSSVPKVHTVFMLYHNVFLMSIQKAIQKFEKIIPSDWNLLHAIDSRDHVKQPSSAPDKNQFKFSHLI